MFVFLFLGILLSGLALITGLILSISGLASETKKMRNAGLIIFGVAFVALICSIYFMVNGVAEKVKETIVDLPKMDSLGKYGQEGTGDDLLSDNRYYLLADTCNNPQIKYIKEVSAKKGVTFKNSFYTYFGSQGFARMP